VVSGNPVAFVSKADDGVPRAPPLTKLPLAVPVKAAVIVPAAKLPEASRATIALAVLAATAVVAELLTFNAVEIVASFVSAMPADALMSALTIAPAVIEVALPIDVIGPVKFAFIVAAPVVFPVPPFSNGRTPVTPDVSGRPVMLVAVPLAGIPSGPPLSNIRTHSPP
jgi:hypothetical protein